VIRRYARDDSGGLKERKKKKGEKENLLDALSFAIFDNEIVFIGSFAGICRIEQRMHVASHTGSASSRQRRLVPRESGATARSRPRRINA
jgi:hypothetical protein